MASPSPRPSASPAKQNGDQPGDTAAESAPAQGSEPAASSKRGPDSPGTAPPGHINQQHSQPSRAQAKTPEPVARQGHLGTLTEGSPSTLGHLSPFGWDDFEARYEQALAAANRQEQELLEEFDQLVKYFNVWASAGSAYDNERGVKRLQTRERYVRIAEQSLAQKREHLTEVVRAFQSALALLSQT